MPKYINNDKVLAKKTISDETYNTKIDNENLTRPKVSHHILTGQNDILCFYSKSLNSSYVFYLTSILSYETYIEKIKFTILKLKFI